jgi:hypothetical protein
MSRPSVSLTELVLEWLVFSHNFFCIPYVLKGTLIIYSRKKARERRSFKRKRVVDHQKKNRLPGQPLPKQTILS